MPCGCANNVHHCGNPCGVSPANTAACESLPSQIANFTLQFFGTVVKTEFDGVVSWSLPCNLNIGLENNPRAVDEGLACYFLRLFQEGITGATGPQGEPGEPGTDGNNAYSVTLASFTQPTLGAPNVTVVGAANPSILEGLYVFIQTSGWYLVNNVSGGTFSLTLARAVDSPPVTVSAGRLIVPAGFPGASITGPQGPKGDKGDTGNAGQSFTATRGQYSVALGVDYNLPVIYTAVNFTNSSPELLLPTRGSYLVTGVVDIIGLSGVDLADIVSAKLYNSTNAADIEGSDHSVSHLVENERKQIVFSVIVDTDGDNQTVSLYGKCSTADKVAVLAVTTTLNFVRLA